MSAPLENQVIAGKNPVAVTTTAQTYTKDIKLKVLKFIRQNIKITCLCLIWLFIVFVFVTHDEKEVVVLQSFIQPGGQKSLPIPTKDRLKTLSLTITGPFMSEYKEKQQNHITKETLYKISVWYETDKNTTGLSVGTERSILLEMPETSSFTSTTANYVLQFKSTATSIIPFTLSYSKNVVSFTSGVFGALVLFVILYSLMLFELVDRCEAAVIVSLCSLAVLALVGERPTLQELVSWLDLETLLLLFSMMIVLIITAETGIFDFLAVFAFEKTRGRMWPLITTMCLLTGILSAFLDNVTTMLLIGPVTIRLSESMKLNPVPVLLLMAIFSNIGGTTTPVGDAPNIIITSNKIVKENGINFANFTLHMTLGTIVVCIQTYLHVRFYVYRDKKKLALDLSSLNYSPQSYGTKLAQMKENYKIRNKTLLVKALVVATFILTFFFLHAFPVFHRISVGWTALMGAVLLLILADKDNIELILQKVEWSTLLFFAALFVLMEAVTKLGLINYIAEITKSIITSVSGKSKHIVALLLVLWVSGVGSALLDNIPVTTVMVKIVVSLGTDPMLNLPLAPLVFALSYGSCLGGNGTLIGASANLVCAGIAKQYGYKITFNDYLKIGFPLMVAELLTVSFYMIVVYGLLGWNI